MVERLNSTSERLLRKLAQDLKAEWENTCLTCFGPTVAWYIKEWDSPLTIVIREGDKNAPGLKGVLLEGERERE